MRLKLRQRTADPRSARVWLDNLEVTDSLASLELHFNPSAHLTAATIRITASEVDVDAEAIAQLQAHVKDRSIRG